MKFNWKKWHYVDLGDVAVIGARLGDTVTVTVTVTDSGTAYLFSFDGMNWNET